MANSQNLVNAYKKRNGNINSARCNNNNRSNNNKVNLNASSLFNTPYATQDQINRLNRQITNLGKRINIINKRGFVGVGYQSLKGVKNIATNAGGAIAGGARRVGGAIGGGARRVGGAIKGGFNATGRGIGRVGHYGAQSMIVPTSQWIEIAKPLSNKSRQLYGVPIGRLKRIGIMSKNSPEITAYENLTKYLNTTNKTLLNSELTFNSGKAVPTFNTSKVYRMYNPN
jgi:hypothetical protein